MKHKNRKRVIICILLVLFICLTAGCSRVSEKDEITSLEQLNDPGKKVGVATETEDDRIVDQVLPKAEKQFIRDMISAYTAVSQGKLDAVVYDRRVMELAIENGLQGVRLLDETVGEGHRIAVGISPVSRIPDLEGKINSFIDQMIKDGTMDDMQRRWEEQGDETMPDIPEPGNPEMTIVVGTFGAAMPYSYYVGTELTGRDIEMARRFAAYVNAKLVLKTYDYDGLIAAAKSGDNYWKGIYGHVTANFIAEYYGCPDPYSVTEMEEVAIANTAECFNMLDRLISMRVVVNMDVFMDGETPESTWGEYTSFNEKVENENTETMDIYEPAMHNLFDTASIVIDAILDGKLEL